MRWHAPHPDNAAEDCRRKSGRSAVQQPCEPPRVTTWRHARTRCTTRPWSAGPGPVSVRWSPGAPGRRPGLDSWRRKFGRTGRRMSDRPARRAREPLPDLAACAGRRQSALRPAGRRRRRSTPDQHGHIRRPCCRRLRPARPKRGQRRPRRDPIPGRPWGCPCRCPGHDF
jgi:hypothetical protein